MAYIRGTLGSDRLRGTNGKDLIDGRSGDDYIYGRAEDDSLYGGSGNDTIAGDDDANPYLVGDDRIFGESGNDRLYGNAGDDTIHGGGDNDRLSGDSGNDLLLGDSGHDWLDGGRGNDVLRGGNGRDTLYGADGRDYLQGGNGNDYLDGEDGNDTLYGGWGRDTLLGDDVRDKVSQAVRRLPPDAEPPVVSKADADSSPIIFLNIQSNQRSLMELTEIAETVFKERLQTIDGVSSIQVWGAKTYSMRLWIDPTKLSAYQLTPLDVQNALQRENIELPSGSVEGASTELTVRTLGRLTTPEEFNNLIVKSETGRIVRFRDVGYAELGPENLRTILKRDGIPMVGNAIVPQPGSNHIDIADEFYRRLDQIKKDLPPDIKLDIGFDNTKYIRESITEVQQTIYLAFGLVVLIIFLFLRDWRTTIIPVVVIPISLIGAFFIMYVFNFSINVLTLLGIVLAIGLVVDDAIVVLENIYSKIEGGMKPLHAAILGSKGEARRAIQGNAISINKDKIDGHEATVSHEALLHGKYLMVENGKKNKYIVVAE